MEYNLDDMKNKNQKKISIESPCIRNCCLNYDDICVSCFRHIDEIVSWANYNDKEKLQVLDSCQQREILTVK